MNDEQNEIPEFDEIGLTDNQTRFFSEHEDKIKRYWAESDLENLSKEANFFLNQFKNSLRKNNELKEINKYLGQRINQEQSSKKEEIAKQAHRETLQGKETKGKCMIDYPLHPQQTHAEPLYCQIPLEEYEKLKEVEKLYKNIMKMDRILRETDYLREECTLSNLDKDT